MTDLIRGYGRALVAVFAAVVLIWALLLILLPQVTMLERAMTAPKRQLDSTVAGALANDAQTCIGVLQAQAKAAAAPAGVPSMGGMARPSAGMGLPSMGGGGTGRPYILQCDRTDTHQPLVRASGTAWLDETYDLPRLRVAATDPIPRQIAAAEDIRDRARALHARLLTQEAQGLGLTGANFQALFAATRIPMSADQQLAETRGAKGALFAAMGLQFERDGALYKRLSLITLTRTLSFAVLATALALVLCYPIAYKVALATPPDRAVWLFLGLVIPYAIVELMRVYAWTAIIDNRGLINSALDWIGMIDLDAGQAIQFKRMPGTVFLVIVYTYVLFMVFPIFNVMNTLDRNQIEAARDLGARMWRVHWRIVIPHAKPGIAVGCIATFMLAAGAFSVPRIISRGLQAEWFSQTIYNKFFESENSNIGAAYSFAYTLVCFGIVALFMWAMRTRLKDFARVQ
ncbi:ABC transporter permease [Rhodovulum adriaticum]|uniref:ABC-type spermidine/putrescine transport system permease subunit I n=1 Tax=Rhodovulum adriaticum TaxID=35804 RepID=A0A4R2NMG9_RHOAD|nr:ABC transporter permease [Rhodovulum adriaticum]MBK1635758.1 ABC transporter permease [Rhodovulum adriaticum]TCP22495.1 ABC-type spermidine/putrescine transport system permease subunit I [Rhodovulum adriaticum]